MELFLSKACYSLAKFYLVIFFKLFIGLSIGFFVSIFTIVQAQIFKPHTAEYEVNYGRINLGTAKLQLGIPKSNDIYTYHLNTKLSLLLLSDLRQISSTIALKKNVLQPIRYMHNRTGTGKDYSEQIAFAHQQKKIYSRFKSEKKQLEYNPQLLDPVSMILKLRLDVTNNQTPLKYSIVKKNKAAQYEFALLTKETITISNKKYKTVKYKVVRKSNKRETYFWLSTELDHLPVRLTHYYKGKKQIEINLLKYQSLARSTKLTESK